MRWDYTFAYKERAFENKKGALFYPSYLCDVSKIFEECILLFDLLLVRPPSSPQDLSYWPVGLRPREAARTRRRRPRCWHRLHAPPTA